MRTLSGESAVGTAGRNGFSKFVLVGSFSTFSLFLLPGGLPLRLGPSCLSADIQAGGRPLRLLRPEANRSSVVIASSIVRCSSRNSESIFKMSMSGRIAQLTASGGMTRFRVLASLKARKSGFIPPVIIWVDSLRDGDLILSSVMVAHGAVQTSVGYMQEPSPLQI